MSSSVVACPKCKFKFEVPSSYFQELAPGEVLRLSCDSCGYVAKFSKFYETMMAITSKREIQVRKEKAQPVQQVKAEVITVRPYNPRRKMMTMVILVSLAAVAGIFGFRAAFPGKPEEFGRLKDMIKLYASSVSNVYTADQLESATWLAHKIIERKNADPGYVAAITGVNIFRVDELRGRADVEDFYLKFEACIRSIINLPAPDLRVQQFRQWIDEGAQAALQLYSDVEMEDATILAIQMINTRELDARTTCIVIGAGITKIPDLRRDLPGLAELVRLAYQESP